MEMHVLKCPHCNADLKIEDGINTFYCQYCGTKIILHGQSDEEIKAKAEEAYYEKHPEERPVPPEPGKPVPTELDYLKEIRDAVVKK